MRSESFWEMASKPYVVSSSGFLQFLSRGYSLKQKAQSKQPSFRLSRVLLRFEVIVFGMINYCRGSLGKGDEELLLCRVQGAGRPPGGAEAVKFSHPDTAFVAQCFVPRGFQWANP